MTIDVLDAHSAIVALQVPLAPGRAAAVASRPVALSTEDLAAINAITTAIQATREDTLWTDDTGAYFVRVDKAGTISWTDISGTAASAPGTGARPADAASFAVDRAGYQATTSGTGYSTGDFLDHFVITDPNSGVVVSHFWLNATTELKLASAPSSANITPFSAEAGVMGLKTDAKSTATDTTAVSGISIWKQVSFSVQAIATSIASLVTGTVLAAGAAIIGKVGIDQTTPGTTNAVAATNLPTTVDTNSGNKSASTLRVVIATDQPANTNALKVDGSAVTQPISAAALPLPSGAGTAANQATIITALATNHTDEVQLHTDIATTLHADLTAATPAGANLIGRAVADASAASGGIASTARMPSAANTTNGTFVKGSAGRIYQVSGKNNAAYDVFLALYDVITNPPVPGTATIRKKMVCPAGQAFVYDWPLGLSFATGIGYGFTKLVADADTTVIAAADITAFNLDYV